MKMFHCNEQEPRRPENGRDWQENDDEIMNRSRAHGKIDIVTGRSVE
jgi:hypothetical protein